jgi:hypothetical protein
MNDFERGTKRIGMSQETQTHEMEQALQKNKENTCELCGAELLHVNKTLCKNFHRQDGIQKLKDNIYYTKIGNKILIHCGKLDIDNTLFTIVLDDFEEDIRENERKQWVGRLQYIENLLNAHWKTPYSDHPPEIPAIIEKIQKFISKGE